MTVQLQSISSASGNPITKMLVNGILNDDQGMVNVAQGAIFARAAMAEVPEYTAGIKRIASGLEAQGVKRDNGTDFGVA